MPLTRADFPDDFLFGAATAAYQIEGHGFGGAGSTHWDTFAATPGNVVRAEDGAIACDHYHRWPDDLDLLRAANMDAYRFSTSWARVMPEGRGTVNPEGLDFYDRLVDGMLARGLKPFQTLYHWEMPSALADLGGWTNRDIAFRFADFAEVITRRIGDRVASIATINEPWCVAWLSHFIGAHAPGQRDIRAAARAMHHILLAHGAAVERLRGMGQPNLGIVLNFDHCTPASDSAADTPGQRDAGRHLQPLVHRRHHARHLSRRGAGGPCPLHAEGLASGHGADRPAARLAGRQLLHPSHPRLRRHPPLAPRPRCAGAPAQDPDGMGDLSRGPPRLPDPACARLCRPRCRSIVTENGMANADEVLNGTVNDHIREDYLFAHLDATRRAIADGANVKGFFYWSLLDNYEWAEGYEKRFGLVHVDFETLQRTPKASYHALARAIAR